jgi:hypothetical protein
MRELLAVPLVASASGGCTRDRAFESLGCSSLQRPLGCPAHRLGLSRIATSESLARIEVAANETSKALPLSSYRAIEWAPHLSGVPPHAGEINIPARRGGIGHAAFDEMAAGAGDTPHHPERQVVLAGDLTGRRHRHDADDGNPDRPGDCNRRHFLPALSAPCPPRPGRESLSGRARFVAAKRRHDPGLLFCNTMWDAYLV